MIQLHQVERQINEFENIVAEYFINDPVGIINNSVEQSVQEYNTWLNREKEVLERKRSLLEETFSGIQSMATEISRQERILSGQADNSLDGKAGDTLH